MSGTVKPFTTTNHRERTSATDAGRSDHATQTRGSTQNQNPLIWKQKYHIHNQIRINDLGDDEPDSEPSERFERAIDVVINLPLGLIELH